MSSFTPFIYYGDGPRVEVSCDDAGNVYAARMGIGNGISAPVFDRFPVGHVSAVEGGADDPRGAACALVDAWARRDGWDIWTYHGGALDVVGYYYGEAMGGPLCPDCHREEGHAPEDPDAHAIFGDSEGDTPTHCEACESLLAHDLTPDGVAYVREKLREGSGRPGILAAWRNAYAHALDEGGTD